MTLEFKDCEGNIVNVGDFIAFQPPLTKGRYAEVKELIKSPNTELTHAHIYDNEYEFAILETSVLIKRGD